MRSMHSHETNLAGIYIHIPFCRQACHYCDFHFSTNLNLVDAMYAAIIEEIHLRKAYLSGEKISTIYFGGGTPSVLSKDQIAGILGAISSNFSISENPEITLEANPEDLNQTRLNELKSIGINRLSIGIQTFDNDRLKYINRTHNSEDARKCISNAFDAGFQNISADLIYALPPASMEYWQRDLNEMIALGLPHISLYGLTIEEKTVFGHWQAKGRLIETPEEIAAQQYRYAIETLTSNGYIQYEVSNFGKEGFQSRHNAAYWGGEKYLGIGPGAHSYNQKERSFNIQNNPKYIKSINDGAIPETIELLSKIQMLNENILTRLRTREGIDMASLNLKFDVNLAVLRKTELQQSANEGLIRIESNHIRLTTEGFMVADEVALRLFFDEN
jgi:oxygen-independent coproporphyrinogen III oxidase